MIALKFWFFPLEKSLLPEVSLSKFINFLKGINSPKGTSLSLS